MSHDARARPRLVGPLAKILLDVFFRRVEVIGLDNVPIDGPVVFVGNHVNSLLDPALLIGYLPRKPRFLAKSTLWSHPLVRPFLELAAAIPVYRRQDEGVDPAKNAETFQRCHEVLAVGGAIALFPEGRSHDEPALVPLKTGVSRIVLEAEERFGGIGCVIVPVGLTFDDKTRFRSRALVNVGGPIDPAEELSAFASSPENAVRGLTARIEDALEAVTLNWPSWDEARLLARAEEIVARPESDGPSEEWLSRRFSRQQLFVSGYRELRARCPEQVAEVAAAVRDYDEDLQDLKLDDAQVASRYPPHLILGFATRGLLFLLISAPLGIVGSVMNVVPFLLARHIAERFAPSPDTVATYKLFSSLLLYPVIWTVEALLIGHVFGIWAGLATLVASPFLALFAVRYQKRHENFWRQTRAFFLLKSGRFSIEKLRIKRQRVFESLRALVELYRDSRV